MHPNPAFRGTATEKNLAFARERGFGTLALSAADGAPLLSHVPFLVSEAGDYADLHLVRSNPMVRAAKSAVPARLAVTGPDSYVSPDWYGVADQVPTWNYVAVHLTGQVEPLASEALPDLLDRLSAKFEAELAPKPLWTRDKMSEGAFERMLRMILPFRLHIEDVQGTWKLGQNKPTEVRHAAASQMTAYGFGSESRELAALMQSPFADPDTE
ncbi:FMN-binding negative transcriptional regulator [Shimia sp. MMG029]|uniref:FMN-binding negative transcriptional regulator n=1 Tax=Shimia sp. MMG029 TaxID=3021978 RepID=UPI0022FE7594|nr:FMN-binding negative transcriptional regulator [Shimia sp. MMG029]MDA5556828.1 FMN-binding negative transcriptional regulator [Shimia sp. MMG029]